MTNLIFTLLLLAKATTATIDHVFTYCEKNDAYESLELCMHECEEIHQNTSKFHPEPDDPDAKMRYKVVQLTEFEFQFDRTGHLVTDLPNPISRDSFVFDTDRKSVYVCYPLDEDFVKCSKWRLQDYEFLLYNNSKQLYNILRNTSYPVGKFYLEELRHSVDAAICIPDASLPHKTSIDYVFMAAYAISALSLALTFVLAIVVPELNIRNNYILLCHLAVMTLAYVLLFLRNILTKSTTKSGCLMLASLQQFSLLASFFWINVQAIDLFMRFIHLRGTRDARTSVRRFVCYCLYAWGCPMVICLVTLGMEKTDIQSFRPNFRLHCWFDQNDSLTMLLYLYGPIAVILFANCVLFVLTVSKLCKVGKTASNVNKNMHNQLLQLYLKLVFVMGLFWVMEVIAWGIGGDERNWYFTELVNSLQGLFIFIIYICKPSYIRRIVYKKSFFPNRPKWWPWKSDSPGKSDQEDHDDTKMHETLSATTSLTVNESVQTNTTNM